MAADRLTGTLQRGPFELSYGVEGQGVPVLVVGSAVYYPRTFSAGLRRHLRLAFVDHRGYGRATDTYGAEDMTLDRVVEDMEALRRHLDLGERVVVLGHSGHGYMALEYAKRYPEAVAAVALVGTGPSHRPEHLEQAERAWAEAVCPERKARFAADMSGLAAAVEADPDNRFVTFCLRMAARSWFDPAYDAAPLWQGVGVNLPVTTICGARPSVTSTSVPACPTSTGRCYSPWDASITWWRRWKPGRPTARCSATSRCGCSSAAATPRSWRSRPPSTPCCWSGSAPRDCCRRRAEPTSPAPWC